MRIVCVISSVKSASSLGSTHTNRQRPFAKANKKQQIYVYSARNNVGKPVRKDLRFEIMKRAIERDFDFEIYLSYSHRDVIMKFVCCEYLKSYALMVE